VRSSWRNRAVAGLASAILVGASPRVAAHRLDEYLLAARIALDPDRVRIELDMTAGVAVAERVIADINRDRTETISADQARAYVASVRRAIAVAVDGNPLSVELLDSRFPSVESLRKGEGAIRIELSAAIPPLPPGAHHLLYRNTFRPDIGAYLANALAPSSDRVSITGQRRDVDQRELTVDYVLDGTRTSTARAWYGVSILCVLLAVASLWWRSRAR
jgi:hypothetical protein